MVYDVLGLFDELVESTVPVVSYVLFVSAVFVFLLCFCFL